MRLPSLLITAVCLLSAPTARAQTPPSDDWQQLREQLATEVTLEVNSVPLSEVLQLLERQTGVQLVLDLEGLGDLGLSSRDTVNISLRAVTLRTMLELALEPLDLTWSARGGVLVVTSEEAAFSHCVTRIYPVSDLVRTADDQPDYDSLIDAVVSTVEPDSWVDNGGPLADIRPMPSAGDAIIVLQTPQVHLQLEELLDDARHLRRQQGLPTMPASTTRSKPASSTQVQKTYVQPATGGQLPRMYE